MYAFNSAAIFLPGHPYIESTTVLSDTQYTHFCRPNTDTCKVCDSYKFQIDAETDDTKKALLSGEWELHKRKAERAYQQLKEDTALSKSDEIIELLTFDLQQSLATPVLFITLQQAKGVCTCSTRE